MDRKLNICWHAYTFIVQSFLIFKKKYYFFSIFLFYFLFYSTMYSFLPINGLKLFHIISMSKKHSFTYLLRLLYTHKYTYTSKQQLKAKPIKGETQMYKQIRSFISKGIEKKCSFDTKKCSKIVANSGEHHSTIKVTQQEKFITPQNVVYTQKTCVEYSYIDSLILIHERF